jgi:hypothetical protein
MWCVSAAARGVSSGDLTNYDILVQVSDFSVADDQLAFSGSDADFRLRTEDGAGTVATGLARGAAAQALEAGNAMVIQEIAKDAGAVALTADVSFFKLTTSTAFTADVKSTLAGALGSTSVTGLAANGNYLVSAYDTATGSMLLGVVNVGSNLDADTTFAANDLVNGGVSLIGVFTMSEGDYAAFGASNLAAVF